MAQSKESLKPLEVPGRSITGLAHQKISQYNQYAEAKRLP